MRIKNNTDEPITIEPGETINVRYDKDIIRTMSQRIDKYSIKELIW